MRWLTFMIFTVVVLTFQSAFAPRVELFGIRPDWLLGVVVFFAMYARPSDAVAGAWIIGACGDLMTIERLGLLALSYGLAAMLVTSVREYLFRYYGVTQFVVTFLVCLLIRVGWTVYRRVLYGPVDPLLIELMTDCLLVSLYTAAWVPLMHKVLLSVSRWFGIVRPRYTYAGLHGLVNTRV